MTYLSLSHNYFLSLFMRIKTTFFFVFCSCQFELFKGARLTVLEIKIL